MSNIRAQRLARILVPEDEFRLRRIQRAEARSHRAFVGGSDVYPSPYIDDAVRERKAKVFELVHRQQGKGGRLGPAAIVSRNRGLSWTPPLPDAHTLEDPLSDVAGRLIVAMNAIPTWTREKRTIYENLLRHLKKENYYFFRGSLRTYPIARTGASVLYKVPGNKIGHLARFRNQTIRLLRTGSGGFGTAHFAAKDLVILKT